MQFIIDLPNAKEHNQCWVIVDRFTKMADFVPLKNWKAKELGLAFVREIWRLHGLPNKLVSDQDSVVMRLFWTEVLRLIEVKQDKSSAYNPQTDRQTEQVNYVLVHYIRMYCFCNQDDWVELL